MKKIFYSSMFLILLATVVLFGGIIVSAAPSLGEQFYFTQPDGTEVPIIIYGDEFYRRVESLDGFSLAVDSQTGYVNYARLNEDGTDFEATGIVYTGQSLNSFSAMSLGVMRGLSLDDEHISSMINERIRLLGRDTEDEWIYELSNKVFQEDAFVPQPEVLQVVRGITIVIEFPDSKLPQGVTLDEIDDYLNLSGYNGRGNNGSIYDYFADVSGGRLEYTNRVFHYNAINNRAFYDDNGATARDLVNEALAGLENNQDFLDYLPNLTVLPNGRIPLNIFYAGTRVGLNWGVIGLWPHANYGYAYETSTGVRFRGYQITDIGIGDRILTLDVFAHETGHILFGWPDLYALTGNFGLGNFCLMASMGDARNPVPPTAYFRMLAGWGRPRILNHFLNDTVINMRANAVEPYVFYTTRSNEFFLTEYIQRVGRYANLPAISFPNSHPQFPELRSGVVIYQIDARGSNLNPWLNQNPLVWVVSANPQTTHVSNSTSFPWGNNNSFTPSSTPNSNLWGFSNPWDKDDKAEESHLSLTNISTMGSFTYHGGFTTVTTPNLKYIGANNTFEIGTIRLSATGALQGRRVNTNIRKYNALGEFLMEHTLEVNINATTGIGEFTLPQALNSFSPGEYIEISVYVGNVFIEEPINLMARRRIHPVLFGF
jgi:M6 family metalloprotease-like protein